MEPAAYFQELVNHYHPLGVVPPFNEIARTAAGLPKEWYAPLADNNKTALAAAKQSTKHVATNASSRPRSDANHLVHIRGKVSPGLRTNRLTRFRSSGVIRSLSFVGRGQGTSFATAPRHAPA